MGSGFQDSKIEVSLIYRWVPCNYVLQDLTDEGSQMLAGIKNGTTI